MNPPNRKRPAHHIPFETGNRQVIIFLTVCVRDRRPLLATSAIHASLADSWRHATHWLVGRYVVMPDHIHLFCSPGTIPMQPLGSWVRYWQNLVTRAWSDRTQVPIWQKDYWDRQLRSGDSYNQKWHYVVHNPVRHGLCAVHTEWEYQGELTLLRWHEP